MKEVSIMQVRSGLIDGHYETGQVFMDENRVFNNSFIYLILLENRAVITLIADNITPAELDYMWKQMFISIILSITL